MCYLGQPQIKYIFDEFYQVGNEQRDRTQGLGLGLSIAKKTADLLGLPIFVTSEVGLGTTFSVRVAYVEDANTEKKNQNSSISDTPNGAPSKTVLIIDDDPIVLESLTLRIEAWNHKALPAMSLEEAQEILREDDARPDVIISDLRLSDTMDGVKAIAELRETLNESFPGIILTGDTASARLEYIQNAGLKVLHKPIVAQTLAKVLDEAFAS